MNIEEFTDWINESTSTFTTIVDVDGHWCLHISFKWDVPWYAINTASKWKIPYIIRPHE